MKKIHFILSILLIVLVSCNTETNKTTANKSDSASKLTEENFSSTDSIRIDTNEYMYKQLLPIRKTIKLINEIEVWSYNKKIENSDAYKEEKISFSHKDDSLIKIEVETYEVEQQSITEYYSINDELIFVYENTVEYNRPIYYDTAEMIKNNDTAVFDINKAEIIEDLSYFKNSKLIRQTNNRDCGAPFAEEYLLEEEKRLLKEFETHKNNILNTAVTTTSEYLKQ